MKNFVMNSIIEWSKFNIDYRLEVFCYISDETVIPEDLRKNYEKDPRVVFILDGGAERSSFDFETGMMEWDTSFNGKVFRLGIPAKDVFAISNGKGFVMQFTDDLFLTNKPTPKLKSSKPNLSLVKN